MGSVKSFGRSQAGSRRHWGLLVAATCVGAVIPPGLFAGSESSPGQSLGEVAERTRRQRIENGPQRSAPAFDDDDLDDAGLDPRSGPESEISSSPLPRDDREAIGPEAFASERASNGRTEHEHRLRRQQWDRAWKAAMDKAEADLSQASEDSRQCQAASRYFYVPIRVDCTQVPRRMAEAKARVSKLRRNRYSWDGTENDEDD